MNHLPFIESSLTIDELFTIVEDSQNKLKMVSFKFYEAFSLYALKLAHSLRNVPSADWVALMFVASVDISSTFREIESGYGRKAYRASVSDMFALSMTVQNTSTLKAFLDKSFELAGRTKQKFDLTADEESKLAKFISGIFTFWLAVDQLDSHQETRTNYRAISDEVITECASTYPTTWTVFREFMQGSSFTNSVYICLEDDFIVKLSAGEISVFGNTGTLSLADMRSKISLAIRRGRDLEI
jgi:hypothetical protein